MMIIGLVVGRSLFAVVRRMHVGDCTGHENAVELVEQRVEMERVHDGRDHHRCAPGHLGDGAHILVADRVV